MFLWFAFRFAFWQPSQYSTLFHHTTTELEYFNSFVVHLFVAVTSVSDNAVVSAKQGALVV